MRTMPKVTDDEVKKTLVELIREKRDEEKENLAAMYQFYREQYGMGDFEITANQDFPLHDDELDEDLHTCLKEIDRWQTILNRFDTIMESIMENDPSAVERRHDELLDNLRRQKG